MNGTRTFVALLLIAAVASPVAAQSDSAQLVTLNRGYVDAFIHGRSAWYDAHLTPEFRCLCPSGSIVPRAQFVEGAKQPMPTTAPTGYKSFGLDSVEVRIYGDIGIITAVTPWERLDGTTGASRYTDIWVKRNGEWKTVQAQITPIRKP